MTAIPITAALPDLPVPLSAAALRALSATRLAALIRAGAVSALAVVDAHIARIAEVDPVINALIDERFAAARDEARAVDARIAATAAAGADRGVDDELAITAPLLGVPITIKQFLAVTGMAFDVGLVVRRGCVADDDAVVVRRLRAAGAIILGVSNVPEGGMWMETHNKVHGRTSNPWQPRRTAGGSSGGEAALVGAGASALGIGSDMAGSIRIPAAFCGVVGHKPTARSVSTVGHWGPPDHGVGRFLCIGPIARSVRDAALALALIADPADERAADLPPPSTEALALPDPAGPELATAAALRQITVCPVPGHGSLRIQPLVRAQVLRAATALAARGARIRADPRLEKLFAGTLSIWARAMEEASAGTPGLLHFLGDGVPISVRRELARSLVGRSTITLPSLGLALLQHLPDALPGRLRRAVPSAASIRDQLEDILGPGGVLLHPPFTRSAPLHRAAMLAPFDFVCSGIFSITELPVTQVPTGFDGAGLPIGVQLAARRGNDRLTLAAARIVEDALGGWTPAPLRRG